MFTKTCTGDIFLRNSSKILSVIKRQLYRMRWTSPYFNTTTLTRHRVNSRALTSKWHAVLTKIVLDSKTWLNNNNRSKFKCMVANLCYQDIDTICTCYFWIYFPFFYVMQRSSIVHRGLTTAVGIYSNSGYKKRLTMKKMNLFLLRWNYKIWIKNYPIYVHEVVNIVRFV